jgi:hypothetical protein
MKARPASLVVRSPGSRDHLSLRPERHAVVVPRTVGGKGRDDQNYPNS